MLAALPFSADDRRDGIFGLAFAMKHIATLLLMCDGHDVGLSINAGDKARARHEPRRHAPPAAPTGESDTPRIFIYDAYPGGIGFSAPLFAMHVDLLTRTRELIAGCACDNGCPSCVGPIGETGPLAKTVALRLLDSAGPRPAPRRHRAASRRRGAQDEVPF